MNRGFKYAAALLLAALGAHCGSVNLGGTGTGGVNSSVASGISPPVISTITPAAASIAGATVVTLSGFGFSSVSTANIITIGTGTTSAATTATAYGLVTPATAGNIETLSFTLPATTPVGVQNVFVTVFNNASNADLTLTVTP